MSEADSQPQFVLCIRNPGYPVSLEQWKIYRLLDDTDAARVHRIRVVDESG